MKKRILYVIDGIEFGGGERVFSQLINGLPDNRFEPFLASVPNDAFLKNIRSKNFNFFPVDFSSRFKPLLLIRLYRIMKGQRIDIVHGQGGRAEFYARLAAGLAGAKYLSTVAMPVEGYDVNAFRRFMYRMLDRFSERFVSCFLVVSSVLEKKMLQDHHIGRKKVVRIYNGIETDFYKPEELQRERRAEVRREYAVTEDEILIGAVGRLVWQKGFEYFIRAIPPVSQDTPKARFILVGEGPLRQELETMAIAEGIRDRIIFAGYRSDVRDVLSAMDIVAVPSVLEGFPMITLEAMAMAKPVVASAIDGIMEQIADGKEGLLVEPKNSSALAGAMKRLMQDHRNAVKLGIDARKRVVRDFTVQKMIAETLRIYEAV
ncbi:MAG: glycosyltransferase family 4 protein [Syntrophales bacterium]